MAIQYQVNIQVTSGCDFRQEFTLANPDLTPKNITGAKFKAGLAKHAVSIDALLSTRDEPVYKIVPFTTTVVDGGKGVYSIGLTAAQTNQLQEGKYVYNVVLVDANGYKTEVVTGLAFVEKGFASLLA